MLRLPPGVTPGGRFAAWSPRGTRYVVCDVDGTLVGPEDHASDEVVTAVDRAQRAGLRVGLATGRMRDAVAPLIAQLGARGPHLLHNGAEVRDDGRTVVAWSLTPEHVDALLGVARGRDDAYLEVYTESGYVVSAWDERARPHWTALGIEPRGTIEHAGELGAAAVPKATFTVFDPGAAPEIVEAITALGLLAGPAGSPRTPQLTYVNATHPDAGKGEALRRAAGHLGVPISTVAAIGDAENDLSMLAVAGTAIAMGQAPQRICAAAHLVVPEVDAHGVAVALDAIVAFNAARG